MNDKQFFPFKLGLTIHQAELPPQSTELQEKEEDSNKKCMGKLIRKNLKIVRKNPKITGSNQL